MELLARACALAARCGGGVITCTSEIEQVIAVAVLATFKREDPRVRVEKTVIVLDESAPCPSYRPSL